MSTCFVNKNELPRGTDTFPPRLRLRNNRNRLRLQRTCQHRVERWLVLTQFIVPKGKPVELRYPCRAGIDKISCTLDKRKD